MDTLEKSHQELMTEIRPLKEAISAMNFIQKVAVFLTVAASAAVVVAQLMRH